MGPRPWEAGAEDGDDDPDTPAAVDGRTSWGVGRLRVLRPNTPWRWAESAAGTSGAASLIRATRPDGRRALCSPTSKACSIRAVVPDTGISRPSDVVDPTASPVEASHDRVAARMAGSGPKVEANCPGAR